MKKTILFFHLICLFCLSGLAQLQGIFPFQKDDTILKKNYFEQSVKKKTVLLASTNEKYIKEYKEIYDNQFKEIGNMLQSTRIVTEPEVHGYLQSVLQKIIIANDELKGMEMRVVFSRDWWPNAYCMMDGTICINAGLMIVLNNEAELAFVICHELSHYYLDHSGRSIAKYIETINSKEFQGELKRLSKEQYKVNQQLDELSKTIVFDSRRHNRDHEAEADMQAFHFLKKTNYDCNAIKTTLQLLDKIDDISVYQPLDIEKIFQFDEYPFKKKWIQKESAIFSQLNSNDSPLSQKEKDSLKTHPDCSKRILILSDSIQKNIGKNNFLIDEKTFNKLKKNFFVEMTEQCYKSENLGRNLYYSLLLIQANENMPVAIYSVVRCLNKIYDNQKNHRLGLTVDRENKFYPADYNNLLLMLSRLRLEEIANLDYYFCKKYADQVKNYKIFEHEKIKAENLNN